MKVYTVEQMRRLEQAADEAGHSYATMMERAGEALARVVEQWVAEDQARLPRLLVLAGPGNNGGDGLVAATHLAGRGVDGVAYLWKRAPEEPLVVRAREQGVTVIQAEEDGEGRLLQEALARSSVVLDALFGTGLSRPIEGKAREILMGLQAAREGARQEIEPLQWPQRVDPSGKGTHRLIVVAVDIPSGIHGDSGSVDEATVPAACTVTFAGPKIGMLAPAAVPLIGELVVADIGIPPRIGEAAEAEAELLVPARVARFLPHRAPGGHKGTFGTVLVVGGSARYVGAPALSALAAGRSGAGLVTLAVPLPIQPLLAARPDLTTATWLLLPHDMGSVRAAAVEMLREPLERATAMVLGPGLGEEESARRFVWRLLGLARGSTRPLGFTRPEPATESGEAVLPLPPTVIDADGLNALAAWEGEWSERVSGPLVLTPHPGEMGRLLGWETGEVQANRIEAARQAARRWGQVVVLKGAYTIVAAGDGRLAIAPYANDALAKAGSGDILAGIIAALLGQGVAPYEAACLAVVAHGLAGERLRQRTGARGAIASDLLGWLPEVWRALASLAS